MMTPALGFFYGGMVRRKNILSTLNASFILIALISVQWVLFGYSLAFGTDVGGVIGGLNFLGLGGVGRAEQLCSDGSSSAVRRIPDDVCHHHPRSDHGCICGKDAL